MVYKRAYKTKKKTKIKKRRDDVIIKYHNETKNNKREKRENVLNSFNFILNLFRSIIIDFSYISFIR